MFFCFLGKCFLIDFFIMSDVPTGTVDFSIIIVPSLKFFASSVQTFFIDDKSAFPFLVEGVSTAIKIILDSFNA